MYDVPIIVFIILYLHQNNDPREMHFFFFVRKLKVEGL